MLSQFVGPNGVIGHDYYHQFVRFLIGAAHFSQNGFSVPNYTAALCGGIGVFADPQSAYYSLPQVLTFFMEPWLATKITLWIFYFLGYVGFYLLCRRWLNVPLWLGHIGALMFLTNGFSFSHLYVGHLTHHTYLLLPWYLYLLLVPIPSSRPDELKLPFFRPLSLALLLAYMLYSGSVHMLVVFVFATLLCVPYLVQRCLAERAELKRAGWFAAGIGLFMIMAAAKLYAVAQYSPAFFIRGIDYPPGDSFLNFLRYFWFLPQMTAPAWNWGNILMGAWEYLGFVSKLSIPSLVVALVWGLRGLLAGQTFGQRRSIWIVTLSTLALVLAVSVLALNVLGNESLPFMKSYHNPIKILAAFIPFICLFSVQGLNLATEKLMTNQPGFKWAIGATCMLLLLIEFRIHTDFYTSRNLGLEFGYNPALYEIVKANGKLPEIKSVAENFNDWDAIGNNSTRLHCYEPSFGYGHEAFHHQLSVGPTDRVDGGYFNLTHPGCLVYPRSFGCERFSRIPEAERENFQRFIRGEAAFEVPLAQEVLFWVSGLAILFSFSLWLFSFRQVVRSRVRPNHRRRKN